MVDILKDIGLAIVTNTDVLQLLGLVIGLMLTWLLKRLLSWVGLKLRADQLAMLSSAVDKSMTLAVVRAEKVIDQKGWSDLTSRSSVINTAIPILEDKFAETLRANGLDPGNDLDRQRIRDMMDRMLPDIFSRLAASPATPPSTVIPVAAVSPAPGA